jgi:hypothetical protein
MSGIDFAKLNRLQKAASGDMIFVCTPATKSTVHTSTARTRTVTVELQDALGNVHTWFTKDIATGVSIADASSAGTATIPSTTLSFVDGVASVVVSCDANTWAAADTDTLTVAQATIMGYTVAAKTSVETFT